MVSFALLKGGRYRARVILNWAESFAGNDMVASKFRSIGFSDVLVRGSGSQRIIEGDWMNDDVEGEMPSQIDEVMVVSEPPVVVEKKEDDENVVDRGGLMQKIEVKKVWVWYDPRTWFLVLRDKK